MMVRRAFIVLLAICLGCSAQAPPSGAAAKSAPASSVSTSLGPVPSGELALQIERQVRVHYSLPPDVKLALSGLRASDFANYDELTITFVSEDKKQPYDFLLSRDHKTLVRITKMDLSKDPYLETMKKIDWSGRPTRGNKNAKVVMVSYDDFECPFCSRMHATLFPEIYKEYGDRVLIVYKDYPLEEIHPWAVHAAIDANCLAAQSPDAYWEYADYLHANQRAVSAKGRDGENAELDRLAEGQGRTHGVDNTKLQACLKAQDDKAVRASLKEGDELGVNATPAVFVNGQKLDGAVPVEQVREVLDQALRDAGVDPPKHRPASADAKASAGTASQ
ncbi:MAG TPA: thioredoxin domain-containing protein [Terriglobales bacterium]|nr:thioredoxin domain-containing protein [Terriglobales bacterium]